MVQRKGRGGGLEIFSYSRFVTHLLTTVHQMFEYKLAQFFPNVAQKYPQQLILKSDVFKIAQKFSKYLGYFD